MGEKKLDNSLVIYKDDFSATNNCILEYLHYNGKTLRIKKNSKVIEELQFSSLIYFNENRMKIESNKGQAMFTFQKLTDLNDVINWLKNENFEKQNERKELLSELLHGSYQGNIKEHSKINKSAQVYLRNKINEFLNEYNSNYYGPVSTICQSSGFGKSRACEGLVDENFFVIFCCLRDKDSIGYPARSCMADYLLIDSTDENKVIINFKSYLNLFVDLLNEEQNISCKEFSNKYNQNDNKRLVDLMGHKIKKTNIYTELTVYNGTKPLIYVFDESSSLLKSNKDRDSNYFILRNLLQNLKRNIFVLFTDTFTNLSEYIPIKSQSHKEKVFEPIYLLPTWDLYADYTSIKKIKDTDKFENVGKFGRVLWGSLINTKKNSRGPLQTIKHREIFELVVAKLIGNKDLKIDKLDKNDNVAILCTRLGTVKPKSVSTSQNLVAKNMAVCTYVNIDENHFEIEYPSEPILSLAGAYLMGQSNLINMLNDFTSCIESSLISQGEKGEMIVKFILINTIDFISATKKGDDLSKLLQITQVGEFIQSLYGSCGPNCGNSRNNWRCKSSNHDCAIRMINLQINNSSELLCGFINFNHFTRAKFFLKETCLVTALKRRAAIHCRMNQQGIDLVIPVSLNKKKFNKITAIMVQVKLKSQPTKPAFIDAFDGISPTLVKGLANDKPYLLLFMQLGLKNEKPYIENIKDAGSRGLENAKRAIIYSEGISSEIFPNLSNDLIKILINFSLSDGKLFKSDDDNKIYDFTRFSV
ncbi:unnamed protein product [Brachionus calyciflorus]|uniref:Uncharacterized protein n=1 Tax=Brachionus calyciflorus TaxID=104777 RepID=A0A814KEY6_9BILA|nr:unnamed protein product [Brachionus calyciflorus]